MLYTSILAFAYFSCYTHIYNNNTFTLYHLAWEFEKPFIISFTALRFIQPKINGLLILGQEVTNNIVDMTYFDKQTGDGTLRQLGQ